MHTLLRRQLKRQFGSEFVVPMAWQDLIDAVDSAYREFDEDRRMLERSLDLSSHELIQANSEMRAIFQAIPDLLFRLDPQGIILDLKAGHTSDLLIARKRLIGRRIQDIPIKHIGDQFRNAVDGVRNDGCSARVEYSLTINGTECFYEARLVPLLGQQIVVIVQNVSDRRHAEDQRKEAISALQETVDALRGRETELREAERIAQMGSWSWAPVPDVGTWSDELYHIFGRGRDQPVPSFQEHSKIYTPESLALLKAAHECALRDGTPYTLSLEFVRPDDFSRRWVLTKGESVCDADGRVIKLRGTVQDITDRMRAEEEIVQLLRTVRCLLWQAEVELLASGEFFWTINIKNPEAAQLFLRLDIPEGGTYSDAFLASKLPEEREQMDNVGHSAIAAGEVGYNQEFRVRSASGELRWLFEDVSIQKKAANRWSLTGVCTDVTEHKRAAETLREHSRSVTLEADIGKAITLGSGELTETLHLCSEAIVSHLNATLVRIWILKHPGKSFVVTASAGLHAGRDGESATPLAGDQLIGFVAQERRPIFINDLGGDPRAREFAWAAGEGVASLAAYPLLVGDKILGVLGVFCRSMPSEPALTTLLSVANIIALGIERKYSEEAMRQSEASLANAQRTARLGSWVWTLSTGELSCSEEMYRLFDIEPNDEHADFNMFVSRIHPEDREAVLASLHNAVEGVSRYSIEYRIVRRDTTELVVHAQGEISRDAAGNAISMAGTALDITERKRVEARLVHDALHDGLTGLANRALLSDHIGSAFLRFRRSSHDAFALLLVDLDRFKNVNDTLGHPAGDRVLLETAERFRAVARTSDTIARLGGDEFAILLENMRGEDSPTRVAQRLIKSMESPFDINGTSVEIGASVGIVVATPNHNSTEEIFRDADIALYRAKAAGRGGYQVFDHEMHLRIRERMELEGELRRALDRREMTLYLQPIVSLSTGLIKSFEALLRWQHPSRGFVSPSVFIPIAEETGIILAIGEWVTRESCRILRHWPSSLSPSISINASPSEFLQVPSLSVNVSGRELAVEGIDAKIARIAEQEDIKPDLLRIEVTEGVMISDPVHASHVLEGLVAKGFRLLLDDFGTGYSALAYLQDLPFFQLKLDRGFTAKLQAGNRTHELMRGIITLAHNIGLEVVAEGVETAEQLALLRAAGCDHAQGYLISRPVPVPEAHRLFDARKRW